MEEQGERRAWKDGTMREDGQMEGKREGERETCHSTGRIVRMVFILRVLLQRKSQRGGEGERSQTAKDRELEALK